MLTLSLRSTSRDSSKASAIQKGLHTVVSVMLLVILSAWFVNAQALDQKIPQNTILYVGADSTAVPVPQYPNYEAACDQLMESLDDILEWRVIKSEWQALLQQAGAEDDFSALRGNPWAFAVLGMDEAGMELPSLLYLAQVSDPQKADKVISGLFKSLSEMIPGMKVDYDDYHGYPIRSLYGPGMIPGLGLSYSFQDSMLIVSNSKPQIVKLYDQWEFEGENLTDVPLYQQIMAKLPQQRNWTFFYDNTHIISGVRYVVDMLKEMEKLKKMHFDYSQAPDEQVSPQADSPEEMAQALDEISQKMADELRLAPEAVKDVTGEYAHDSLAEMQNGLDEARVEIEEALTSISKDTDLKEILQLVDTILPIFESVQGIGAAWAPTENNILKTTTVAQLKPEALQEGAPLAAILNREPAVFPFRNYLPRKTGNYTATNLFGLPDIWGFLNTVLAVAPEGKQVLEQFNMLQEQFGYSIEKDLLSWMGNEWSIVRPVMDLESVIPINQAALLLRVTDEAQALRGLEKLAQILIQKFQVPIILQKEQYRGQELVTCQLPIPLIPVIPSWSVSNNILVLGSHASLVREMLDAKDGRGSGGIQRNRYYQQLSAFFDQPANKITFQDIESETYANREAVRRVASVSELGKTISSDEEMLPFVLLDRVSYLLTLMMVNKASVKHLWIDENRLMSDKYLLKRDLTSIPPNDYLMRYKVSAGAKDLIANLAATSSDRGDMQRAVRLYSLLAEFYPKNGQYLSILANLYQRQESNEEAISVYDQAMEFMPETALLIKRESLRKNVGGETIQRNIREAAQKTQRIREDAALFGTALHLQEPESSILLNALIQNQKLSPLSVFASQEAALIEKKEMENVLKIPLAISMPNVDGSADDKVWQHVAQVSLTASGGDSALNKDHPVSARIARTPSAIFVRLTAPIPQEVQLQKTSVRVRMNPSRDYVNWIIFEADKAASDSDVETRIVHRTQNFFDILLDSEQKESVESIEWPAVFEKHEDQWVAELAIPTERLQQSFNQIQDTWLINIQCTLKTDRGTIEQFLAAPQGESKNPAFRYATLE